MITHKEFKQALWVIETYIKQTTELVNQFNITDEVAEKFDQHLLYNSEVVDQCGKHISIRTFNNIRVALDYPDYHIKVSDLKYLSKSKLLNVRGAGKTALKEVDNLCTLAGFKMLD